MDKLTSGLDQMADVIISENALIEKSLEFKTYLKFKDQTPLFNLIMLNSRIWLRYFITTGVYQMMGSYVLRLSLQLLGQRWSNLTIEDILVNYTYAHIFISRASNYAQLLRKDIFILWAIKNKLSSTGHIIYAKEQMFLPYYILVMKILEHHEIDGIDKSEITPGSYNRFNAHTLTRMNIKHINGGWQYVNEVQHHQHQNVKEENAQEDVGTYTGEQP
ncbi:hypothetical protein CR513_57271, partial [Mucuna pruriens]